MAGLSYKEKQKKIQDSAATRIKHLNDELRLNRSECRLLLQNNSLIIRYQDPASDRGKRISPKGVDISDTGISNGFEIAQRISLQIKLDRYSEDWLQREIYRSANILTFGDAITAFPSKWLRNRASDPKSTPRQKQNTLTTYRRTLTRIQRDGNIPDLQPFDRHLISQILDRYPPGWPRKRVTSTLSVVCSTLGISYDFKGKSKTPKTKEREIPRDSEIEAIYQRFETFDRRGHGYGKKLAMAYQWIFAVLATYGLRSHEIFAIDLERSFKPETHYWLFLDDTLTDGLKTGRRAIPPLLPEWVDKFAIADIFYPFLTSSNPSQKANAIGRYFHRHKLGIKPYDLRHAYAIRSRRFMTVLDAANSMGHDVATHTRIYQQYITDEMRIESVMAGYKQRGLI
jgi:integrase